MGADEEGTLARLKALRAELIAPKIAEHHGRTVKTTGDGFLQAQSWVKPRRVVAKVEWHRGELYPRVGFIVTNLTRPAERVVRFYHGRGTAEQ